MAILDKDTLVVQTLELMGGTADDLGVDARNRAADQALSELGWAFPIADGQASHWSIERTRRHILFILMTIASSKFQYKQIHLEHRFKHLKQMIDKLDEDFLAAVEDNPVLFSASASAYDNFAFYIKSGFTYSVEGIEV